MGAYAGTRGQSIDIALGGGQVGRLSSIYFSPDTANLFETYHSTLESTGRQLAANPSQRIVLRAYTAHFGTPNGRFIVSTERARFCRDYLIQQYGIATNRITIEVYGSDKAPEQANATWESYRCAELIIVGN
jgi:outer membrane protein OmpA-like peptidoglycan-associated protein